MNQDTRSLSTIQAEDTLKTALLRGTTETLLQIAQRPEGHSDHIVFKNVIATPCNILLS